MTAGAPHVRLRLVEPDDLDWFFAMQLDPVARRMAAFVHADPGDRAAFDAHWARVLSSAAVVQRTIIAGREVAGCIGCFPSEGAREVSFWIGRESWGRGIASEALRQLLRLVAERPVLARTASDNAASLRVLRACGFELVGHNVDFAHGRGEATEESLLRLDAGR